MMANSRSPTEKTNGVVQLPVRSRIQPNANGERMPATAPAAFINALDEPAKFGAMSMAAIHSGAIATPKKNKADRKAGESDHQIVDEDRPKRMRHLRQVSQPSLVWPRVRRRYDPAPTSDWHLHARIGVNVARENVVPVLIAVPLCHADSGF